MQANIQVGAWHRGLLRASIALDTDTYKKELVWHGQSVARLVRGTPSPVDVVTRRVSVSMFGPLGACTSKQWYPGWWSQQTVARLRPPSEAILLTALSVDFRYYLRPRAPETSTIFHAPLYCSLAQVGACLCYRAWTWLGP